MLIYVQILLGATMRHTGAGLAIPTFPLAFGHVLPPVWSPAIAIHFAHRAGALVVLSAILTTAVHVYRHERERRELARPAALLVLLALTQATLGAFVVMSGLQPFINTLHVVNGALVLGTSLVLTLRAFRPIIEAQTVPAPRSGFGRRGSRSRVRSSALAVRLGAARPGLEDGRRSGCDPAHAKPRQ